MRRRFLLMVGICLALALAPALSRADDEGRDRDDEHGRADEVFRLRQEGKLKPLAEIMETVQEQFPGRILETEFEKNKGLIIYEFYVLQADGIVREIKVDARSGRILTAEVD